MPDRLPQPDLSAPGILRAARKQITKAIDTLARRGDNPDAIHAARKSLKKARSTLRLLRPTRPELYQRENTTLRDAAQQLAPLRDQHVLIETLDTHFAEVPGYAAARQHLATRTDPAVLGQSEHTHDAVPAALGSLRRARLESPAPPEVSLDNSAATGWRQTLRRMRKAYKKAKKSRDADDLHTLRKRLKDFDYQARLLRPKRLKRVRRLATRITTLLGDHHDLTLLLNTLSQADPHDPALLDAINTSRDKLARKALRKTKRLLKAMSDKP